MKRQVPLPKKRIAPIRVEAPTTVIDANQAFFLPSLGDVPSPVPSKTLKGRRMEIDLSKDYLICFREVLKAHGAYEKPLKSLPKPQETLPDFPDRLGGLMPRATTEHRFIQTLQKIENFSLHGMMQGSDYDSEDSGSGSSSGSDDDESDAGSSSGGSASGDDEDSEGSQDLIEDGEEAGAAVGTGSDAQDGERKADKKKRAAGAAAADRKKKKHRRLDTEAYDQDFIDDDEFVKYSLAKSGHTVYQGFFVNQGRIDLAESEDKEDEEEEEELADASGGDRAPAKEIGGKGRVERAGQQKAARRPAGGGGAVEKTAGKKGAPAAEETAAAVAVPVAATTSSTHKKAARKPASGGKAAVAVESAADARGKSADASPFSKADGQKAAVDSESELGFGKSDGSKAGEAAGGAAAVEAGSGKKPKSKPKPKPGKPEGAEQVVLGAGSAQMPAAGAGAGASGEGKGEGSGAAMTKQAKSAQKKGLSQQQIQFAAGSKAHPTGPKAEPLPRPTKAVKLRGFEFFLSACKRRIAIIDDKAGWVQWRREMEDLFVPLVLHLMAFTKLPPAAVNPAFVGVIGGGGCLPSGVSFPPSELRTTADAADARQLRVLTAAAAVLAAAMPPEVPAAAARDIQAALEDLASIKLQQLRGSVVELAELISAGSSKFVVQPPVESSPVKKPRADDADADAAIDAAAAAQAAQVSRRLIGKLRSTWALYSRMTPPLGSLTELPLVPGALVAAMREVAAGSLVLDSDCKEFLIFLKEELDKMEGVEYDVRFLALAMRVSLGKDPGQPPSRKKKPAAASGAGSQDYGAGGDMDEDGDGAAPAAADKVHKIEEKELVQKALPPAPSAPSPETDGPTSATAPVAVSSTSPLPLPLPSPLSLPLSLPLRPADADPAPGADTASNTNPKVGIATAAAELAAAAAAAAATLKRPRVKKSAAARPEVAPSELEGKRSGGVVAFASKSRQDPRSGGGSADFLDVIDITDEPVVKKQKVAPAAPPLLPSTTLEEPNIQQSAEAKNGLTDGTGNPNPSLAGDPQEGPEIPVSEDVVGLLDSDLDPAGRNVKLGVAAAPAVAAVLRSSRIASARKAVAAQQAKELLPAALEVANTLPLDFSGSRIASTTSVAPGKNSAGPAPFSLSTCTAEDDLEPVGGHTGSRHPLLPSLLPSLRPMGLVPGKSALGPLLSQSSADLDLDLTAVCGDVDTSIADMDLDQNYILPSSQTSQGGGTKGFMDPVAEEQLLVAAQRRAIELGADEAALAADLQLIRRSPVARMCFRVLCHSGPAGMRAAEIHSAATAATTAGSVPAARTTVQHKLSNRQVFVRVGDYLYALRAFPAAQHQAALRKKRQELVNLPITSQLEDPPSQPLQQQQQTGLTTAELLEEAALSLNAPSHAMELGFDDRGKKRGRAGIIPYSLAADDVSSIAISSPRVVMELTAGKRSRSGGIGGSGGGGGGGFSVMPNTSSIHQSIPIVAPPSGFVPVSKRPAPVVNYSLPDLTLPSGLSSIMSTSGLISAVSGTSGVHGLSGAGGEDGGGRGGGGRSPSYAAAVLRGSGDADTSGMGEAAATRPADLTSLLSQRLRSVQMHIKEFQEQQILNQQQNQHQHQRRKHHIHPQHLQQQQEQQQQQRAQQLTGVSSMDSPSSVSSAGTGGSPSIAGTSSASQLSPRSTLRILNLASGGNPLLATHSDNALNSLFGAQGVGGGSGSSGGSSSGSGGDGGGGGSGGGSGSGGGGGGHLLSKELLLALAAKQQLQKIAQQRQKQLQLQLHQQHQHQQQEQQQQQQQNVNPGFLGSLAFPPTFFGSQEPSLAASKQLMMQLTGEQSVSFSPATGGGGSGGGGSGGDSPQEKRPLSALDLFLQQQRQQQQQQQQQQRIQIQLRNPLSTSVFQGILDPPSGGAMSFAGEADNNQSPSSSLLDFDMYGRRS